MDDEADKLEQLTQRRDLLARSCLCTDGLCEACNAVAHRIAELEEEAESMSELIRQQATLLRGVVNAIRGEPDPPSMLWSTHDAPELVQNLVNDLAAIRAELVEIQDHLQQTIGNDYAALVASVLRDRR